MLRRIQGWLKSAGGLSVAAYLAAACLPLGAASAEDENPKVIRLKPNAGGGVIIQVLEEGKDGKVTVQFGEEKEAGEKERKPEKKEGERKEEPKKEVRRSVVIRQAEKPEASYWIGIRCEPVSETLRAQLNLGEGRGLVVEEVVPDSPAAKAGLKKNDVLIQAGETLLDDVPTLVDVVAQTKDGELKLKLVRGGDSQTVTVKPAKRVSEGGFGRGTVILGEQNEEGVKKLLQELEQQVEKLRKGEGRGEVPKIQFWHPGVVLPPGAPFPGQPFPGGPQGWIAHPQSAPLPENMTVTITKSGKEPARITVKQGEKSWETSEDKLDTLPMEVREHVLRMLGRGPMMNPWRGGFGAPRPGAALNPNPNPAQGRVNEPKPGAPLNPAPRNPEQPKIGEPNPKPQGGAIPSTSPQRVIELEVTPGGELKRTERKPGEAKPNLEKEAVNRLEKLRDQLQEQAQRLQAKVAGSVEERLERGLHELHERFQSIENRLLKLEQRFPPLPPRQNQPATNPVNPTTGKTQTIIIREGDEGGKKLEGKKTDRKSDKDDDDKDDNKKDND